MFTPSDPHDEEPMAIAPLLPSIFAILALGIFACLVDNETRPEPTPISCEACGQPIK